MASCMRLLHNRRTPHLRLLPASSRSCWGPIDTQMPGRNRVSIYASRQLTAGIYSNECLSTTRRLYSAGTKDPFLPTYQAPRKGFLSLLPKSWVPYGELMRLDKPAGTNYLFFPCLFSTLLAGTYTQAPLIPMLQTIALFYAGSLIMRGAGCTINDLWDRNLDPHVTRTRLRPIARGAVRPQNGVIFFGAQCLGGLGILLQFPTPCLFYGIPSLMLVTLYPLAKRVTHYPQLVLGLTFSWGAFMGFPALGVDLMTDHVALSAVGALYAACVSWTVLYDMIYAHMDIRDDAKVGIKSLSLKYEDSTKAILTGLAVTQITFLAGAGLAIGANPLYYIGSCGSAAVSLGLMIWKVNLKDPASCWWWFRNGALFTGGAISFGLAAEYTFAAMESNSTDELRSPLEGLQ